MTEATDDVGTNALEPTTAPIQETAEGTTVPETAVLEVSENSGPPESQEDAAPKVHGLKGKTPWYMERINEETNKRRQTEERLVQAERERQEAKLLLDRLQGDGKETSKSIIAEPDIDALVDARAEQKLFNQDCNAVAERGSLDIEGFNDKLGILRSIGVINDDFLKDIFAVDKAGAHKILDHLSQDQEKANLMTRMESRKRIAELTRIADRMTEPVKAAPVVQKTAVSKVPPPKPVIDAVADDSGDADLTNDKMDDATWSKLWDKRFRGKKTA